MAKIKKISKEDIEAINKIALNKIDTLDVKRGRKSESEEFLLDIKEVINKAIKRGVAFTQIRSLIKELYSIEISVNIIKAFAKKHLSYVAKPRNSKSVKTTTVKNKVNNNTPTNGKTASQIKDEMQQKQQSSGRAGA